VGEVVEIPTPRRTLLALAALPADAPPEAWPQALTAPGGAVAAALITDRVDALPDALADPAAACAALPGDLRALVRERNPAMAAYCCAGEE